MSFSSAVGKLTALSLAGFEEPIRGGGKRWEKGRKREEDKKLSYPQRKRASNSAKGISV